MMKSLNTLNTDYKHFSNKLSFNIIEKLFIMPGGIRTFLASKDILNLWRITKLALSEPDTSYVELFSFNNKLINEYIKLYQQMNPLLQKNCDKNCTFL